MLLNDYRRRKVFSLISVRVHIGENFFDIAVPDTNTIAEIFQYLPNGAKWEIIEGENVTVKYEE